MFHSFSFVTLKHVNSSAVVKTRLEMLVFACICMHVPVDESEGVHMCRGVSVCLCIGRPKIGSECLSQSLPLYLGKYASC